MEIIGEDNIYKAIYFRNLSNLLMDDISKVSDAMYRVDKDSDYQVVQGCLAIANQTFLKMYSDISRLSSTDDGYKEELFSSFYSYKKDVSKIIIEKDTGYNFAKNSYDLLVHTLDDIYRNFGVL